MTLQLQKSLLSTQGLSFVFIKKSRFFRERDRDRELWDSTSGIESWPGSQPRPGVDPWHWFSNPHFGRPIIDQYF